MQFPNIFVYSIVNFHILTALSHNGTRTGNGYQTFRQKRSFGVKDATCNLTHGAYLERYDRIDYKRVKFLLADPRYPNLPSFATCVPTFEQPSNWADFFGSRLRTYFVLLQTGNHYFYLSSDAGSELYLSTNEKPETKSLINYVSGGFATYQYEYDRFTNQKSLPVYMKKGKFYYMEAVMKDDHQKDHLEAAVKTPDGQFYKVIPSKFLWTTLPLPPEKNSTYQVTLLKVAARAGARAGLAFGAHWGKRSGAKAGAKAGALAGMEVGASAGARVGEKAALQVITKTIEDGLNNVYGQNSHRFKIVVENGNVVSVTNPTSGGTPGSGGSGAAGGTGGAAGVGGRGGTGGAEGEGGRGFGGTGGAMGSQAAKGEAYGGGAAASMAVKGGSGSSLTVGVNGGGQGQVSAGRSESASGQAGNGASVSAKGSQVTTGEGVDTSPVSSSNKASSQPDEFLGFQEASYMLKPGEDARAIARLLVWKQGAASKLVQDGLYTVHSWDIPYPQENGSLNFCWRSYNGKMALRPFCQVFSVRIPALHQKVEAGKETASFESVCLPGYFLRQKNYNFILQKRDGSELFDKESSFYLVRVMKFSRNLLLKSMHKDWYICQSRDRQRDHITPLELDFYDGDPDVLERCTFSFWPVPPYENKQKNCRNVIGPEKPLTIAGQPQPHPAHLVSETSAQPLQPSCIPLCSSGGLTPAAPAMFQGSTINGPSEPSVASGKRMCVALNFINNFGPSFKLLSSLKHEAYLVTGSGFKLKLIIERPELHSHVAFSAEDPTGKSKLLLNEETSISESPVPGCPVFKDISVTRQGSDSRERLGKYEPFSLGTRVSTSTSQPHPPPPLSLLRPPSPSPPAPASPPPSSPLPPFPPPPPPAPAPPPPPLPPSPSLLPPPSSLSPASSASVVSTVPAASEIPEKGPGSIHYHYHYTRTPFRTLGCPTSCSSTGCPVSCPPSCCR